MSTKTKLNAMIYPADVATVEAKARSYPGKLVRLRAGEYCVFARLGQFRPARQILWIDHHVIADGWPYDEWVVYRGEYSEIPCYWADTLRQCREAIEAWERIE